MREIGRQIVGDPVGEIVLLLVAAQVLERQHDDRKPRRVGELIVNGSGHETRRVARTPGKGPRRKKRESERRGERRPLRKPGARLRRRGGALHFGRRDRHRRFRLRRLADFERIDVDRLGDVLELGRAEIADRHLEPSLDLPVGVLGETDRPGLGDALEPRGDIDAVAHEVAVALLDNVAEVDADAKLDAAFSGGRPTLRSTMPVCTSIAQRTASTTLRNSMIEPSPVRLTMRP